MGITKTSCLIKNDMKLQVLRSQSLIEYVKRSLKLINLHVNITFEEVIKGVERLRFEAFCQLPIQALFVSSSQKRINLLARAETDEVKQVSRTLTSLDWHLLSLRRKVSVLLLAAVVIELQALHAQH